MDHDAVRDAGADRARRRLESWKEIAAYLQRDVRTAQRWECHGRLPVHRLPLGKRGSVFAYCSELDAWRESQGPASETRFADARSASHVGVWTTCAVGVMTVFVIAVAFGLSRLRPAEPSDVATSRAISPDVYETYLKGLFNLERGSRTRVVESIKYFEATVAADRTFTPAYPRLAAAYQQLGSTATGALPVADVQPKAVAIARKALELDPRLASAHSALASAYQQEWRWAEAEAGYRRALALEPGDATTLGRIAGLLVWRGRTKEGLAYARRAREIDPLTVDRTVRLGWLLYHARQYDEAIRELQTVLAAEPEHHDALWFLGFALIDSGHLGEAVPTLERLVVVWDRNPAALGLLARAYGRAGRRADALAIVDELKRAERAGYVPPAPFVHAYVGLGDRDKAFASLERAYRERSNIVQFLKTHPLYDPLRDDRRFAQLLRRVGLE
jgi:tetratricopeptide (TPR) repeat protein